MDDLLVLCRLHDLTRLPEAPRIIEVVWSLPPLRWITNGFAFGASDLTGCAGIC